MPIVSVSDFCEQLREGVLLGVDVGSKTLGLSVCDARWCVASPLLTHHRTRWKNDRLRFLDILNEYDVQGLVVGWPLLMNGEASDRCHSTRHVAENMLALRDLPCVLWDERLSTQASLRVLEKEADLSRQKRARVVDAVASAWILQGAIDAFKRRKEADHDKA
jgi:putative Holliday junction resolvase